MQVTVLNFSDQFVAGGVRSEHLIPGSTVIDMFTDQVIAEVDDDHTFPITLKPHQGKAVLTVPAGTLLRRRVACISSPETRHARPVGDGAQVDAVTSHDQAGAPAAPTARRQDSTAR